MHSALSFSQCYTKQKINLACPYFKLSKNIALEENLQENQRKNYISGMV